MYYKGGNMLHTIRQIVNDDEKWRAILRGLNKTFWHQTVTGKQIEDYISEHAGHRSEQGVRAVPDDHEDPGARIQHRAATRSRIAGRMSLPASTCRCA